MIYKSILNQKSLPLKKRIKRVLEYCVLKRSTRIQWNKQNRNIFRVNPSYNTPVGKSIEQAHVDYWKGFDRSVNKVTFRVCSNASERPDPKYVPEEVFRNDIEPTLNRTSSVEYLQYKSFYNRWFPDHVFPVDYFHNVDGEWLDGDLNSISFDEVKSMVKTLDYPIVCKPNRDSYGGHGVVFPQNAAEVIQVVENKSNIVVQEQIKQHPFFQQFNPYGINSIRVNIYRSVSDNSLHVINMALRMGIDGSLDNLTDGGIVTMIKKDGSLNEYAVDGEGFKHFKHPNTGDAFNQRIPDIEGLKELSIRVAQKLFYSRLSALDICYDQEGNWRVIEVNLFSGTLLFPQYSGVPFFDKFTDEVRDYCLLNHWAVK